LEKNLVLKTASQRRVGEKKRKNRTVLWAVQNKEHDNRRNQFSPSVFFDGQGFYLILFSGADI
jgi:hypothetical protein